MTRIAWIFVACSTLVASTASAEELWHDKTGSPLGVGVGTSVGGTTGAIVSRHFNAAWGVQGVLGFTRTSVTVGEGDAQTKASTRAIGLGAYAVNQVKSWDRLSLSWLAGLELVNAGSSAEFGGMDTSNSAMDFTIAGGAFIEYFLLPGVSVWAQSGLRITFEGDESASRRFTGGAMGDASGYVVKLGHDGMTQVIGFTWWL